MMRAASLYQGRIQVRNVADPTPGPGEVLVRTRACGICASDIHFMDHPEGDLDDDSGMSCYDAERDIVMGHEFCAEVVDYGPATERKWTKGTRVSSIPLLNRPTGRRIIGYSPDAPGAFGEYFVLTEALTQVIEGDLPDELVALSDAMAVGWSYVRRANVQPNEIPLVIGCGAIGLSAVAALRYRGIGPIVAADFVKSRRDTALAMGADIVIDPAELSPFQAWSDVAKASAGETTGLVGQIIPGRGCVVFECVGVPGVLSNIVRSCPRDTRIFSAGGPPEGEHLHTMTAKRKGLNMQFGGGPSMEDWNTALNEVSSGRLDVTPMTGRIVGLDEMPQAIDDARDASGPARIVFKPFA
jgi:threonine dehydrogenase-like Zn-dependent dehydrogenase